MKEYGLMVLITVIVTLVYNGYRIGFSKGKKFGYAIGLSDGRIQMKNEQAKNDAFLRMMSDEHKCIDSCRLYEKERA